MPGPATLAQVASNKRYANVSGWTVSEVAEKVSNLSCSAAARMYVFYTS
jgi:hypothetical protein